MADIDLSPCPFGRPMRDQHFLFAPDYTPLNHGSFGTYPKSVQKRLHEVQALAEARPDNFVRYDFPRLLDESREAMATFLGVPSDEVVFVPNATTAINVVLRSLRFEKGDVILHFSTSYGSVEKTVEYLKETTEVDNVKLTVDYPIDDDVLLAKFRDGIANAKGKGKNIRIAIFDTISASPGVRVPWERLVRICKSENILSLIDGAHGVGQLSLELAKVQPDFFTSNCHKWLYVPRGCALFYVPTRNHHLIRSSIPTSHGYEPLPRERDKEIVNPLMSTGPAKSKFVTLFEFVGTLDVSPYLCIVDALNFRREVCGGEQSIMEYCEDISKKAGAFAAKFLGTEVMQNKEGTLTQCFLTNIRLPLEIGKDEGQIPIEDMYSVAVWITARMAHEYDTFSPVFFHAGRFWTRWSGQIYLELKDFEKGAKGLKALCERVKAGEYRHAQKPLARL